VTSLCVYRTDFIQKHTRGEAISEVYTGSIFVHSPFYRTRTLLKTECSKEHTLWGCGWQEVFAKKHIKMQKKWCQKKKFEKKVEKILSS